MDDIHYDANTNKMHTIEIVFIYKAPCTCSGHLCGQLQGDNEVEGDTFVVLLYKCIIFELLSSVSPP
jgi:hypothetical protein